MAARAAADIRPSDESSRFWAYILELERQLDDAHAVITIQAEALVRLQLQHRDQCHNTR